MIVSGKCKDYNDKLDKLIQSVILNNSQDIDLNNDKELYERLVYLLIDGSLNEELDSDYLKDKNSEEKKRIYSVIKEYAPLCLKNKNFFEWTRSCQGVIPSDYRYICIRILDNYDFLINILVTCGENALRLIDNFGIYDVYKSAALIEILRNRFDFDDILISILKDMCSDNSKFNTFTIEQKAILCFYASDMLYRCRDNVVTFKSPNSIALDIYRYVFNVDSKPSLDDLRFEINNITNFESVVFNYINNKN